MKTAYFVTRPRTCLDLRAVHPVDWEAPFEIVKTVALSGMDYENFLYGMDVDRQYIGENASFCQDGEIKKCILVKRKGKSGGILVVPDPDHPDFVKSAACIFCSGDRP